MSTLMSSGMSRRRLGLIAVAVWSAALVGSAVRGQAPEQGPDAGGIEVDPIKCWWRTDTTAVQVGERFTLAVTCGVVESDAVKVVPDLNQLDPTALEITPFEVVGGTRHEDIQAPPWRYLQYEYAVRLLEKGFFGRDVDIPSLSLKYNIVSSGGETEGREQMYLLPALPMRIMSLVPAGAADIRDASRETFADIEARSRRSTEALVAAAISFGVATVLVGLAFGRTIGRYRRREPATRCPLPEATLLGGCLRVNRQLGSEVARDGWTPERVARALAVFRVAGAVGLGRTVAQSLVDMDAPVREGQLPLRKGILRPKRALISAATSADAIGRQLAAMASGKPSGSRASALLEEIQHSLQIFSATRYGRSDQIDAAALDAALDNGARAIQRLRRTYLWPRRLAGSISTFAGRGAMAWTR